MCELLVGLGDVEVLGVDDEAGTPLRVRVRRRAERPPCSGCGGVLWSNGERAVELADLPAFGRAVRLVWHKRRWRCARRGCSAGTVTEQDPEIAPERERFDDAGGTVGDTPGGPRPLVRGRVGCALDNAAAESFFSTLQHELISRRRWRTRDHARRDIAAWIDTWYNTTRLHSTSNMTPAPTPARRHPNRRRSASPADNHNHPPTPKQTQPPARPPPPGDLLSGLSRLQLPWLTTEGERHALG